ncbi:NADP-dependent oxidoreductase [Paenibacillus sp. Z6-24]
MTNSTMKAVRIHEYGTSDVIRYEEAPIPEPAADEVLIKVAATSFNPFDAQLRSGAFKPFLPLQFPFIPGVNVSGTITQTGSLVSAFQPGDAVFAFLNVAQNGASAEYVVSKAADLVAAPRNMDLHDAAAIPNAALTAWQALFELGNLQPGQRVLITAASGGVGTLAVQLAKWKGAYVIGTTSSRKIDLLEQLGVDQIIDYTHESITEALQEKVDLIFNLSPAGSAELGSLLYLLHRGGSFISVVGAADEQLAESLGIRAIRANSHPDVQQLTEIARLIDAGVIQPIITERVRLHELADVHRRYENKQVTGRVVVIVDEQN